MEPWQEFVIEGRPEEEARAEQSRLPGAPTGWETVVFELEDDRPDERQKIGFSAL